MGQLFVTLNIGSTTCAYAATIRVKNVVNFEDFMKMW